MRPDLYAKSLDTPGPISAHLDTVSEFGTVEGWAVYRDSPAVCHVQIRLGGVVLGEDMADKFRPDLLRARLRYGHCAFYAAVSVNQPGMYPLELADGRTGRSIEHIGPKEIYIPAFTHSSMGSGPVQWTDEQVLANLECLQLEANYERMGVDRFVDAIFRFALGRWADPSAAESYAAALLNYESTPTMVMSDVLRSEERRRQVRNLPGPYDLDFPFGS